MMYELPTSLEIDGVEHPIRSDYRAALDICVALSDVEYTDSEKIVALLSLLYVSPEEIQDVDAAIKRGFWFIACGDDTGPQKKRPKLVDWEQDFPLIVAPVNRLLGREIRALEYMHWWTFISLYQEIGECTFASVVNIRNKRAKGKKLEKHEQDFERENRHLVGFRRSNVTSAEKDFIEQLLRGGE